ENVGSNAPPAVVAEHELTVDGLIMGTPAYMPPEQARGAPVDARADVYAIGAVLYHLLTGASPFRGPTAAAVVARVLIGPAEPIGERVPGIPSDLAAIVEKAMARAPGDRYPTAHELALDLE